MRFLRELTIANDGPGWTPWTGANHAELTVLGRDADLSGLLLGWLGYQHLRASLFDFARSGLGGRRPWQASFA